MQDQFSTFSYHSAVSKSGHISSHPLLQRRTKIIISDTHGMTELITEIGFKPLGSLYTYYIHVRAWHRLLAEQCNAT